MLRLISSRTSRSTSTLNLIPYTNSNILSNKYKHNQINFYTTSSRLLATSSSGNSGGYAGGSGKTPNNNNNRDDKREHIRPPNFQKKDKTPKPKKVKINPNALEDYKKLGREGVSLAFDEFHKEQMGHVSRPGGGLKKALGGNKDKYMDKPSKSQSSGSEGGGFESFYLEKRPKGISKGSGTTSRLVEGLNSGKNIIEKNSSEVNTSGSVGGIDSIVDRIFDEAIMVHDDDLDDGDDDEFEFDLDDDDFEFDLDEEDMELNDIGDEEEEEDDVPSNANTMDQRIASARQNSFSDYDTDNDNEKLTRKQRAEQKEQNELAMLERQERSMRLRGIKDVNFDEDDDEEGAGDDDDDDDDADVDLDDSEEDDENSYKIAVSPLTCPGCGSNFQSSNANDVGFLPIDKFTVQLELMREIERVEDEGKEYTVDREIADLLKSINDEGKVAPLSPLSKALGPKLGKSKRCICQRCYGLQHKGTISPVLRPTLTTPSNFSLSRQPTSTSTQPNMLNINLNTAQAREMNTNQSEFLKQETFMKLLSPLAEKRCIILALIDIFDFSASVLPSLPQIVGSNTVVLACNKADLLPKGLSQLRCESWVRSELAYLGVDSVVGTQKGSVRLISSKTGFGVRDMWKKIRVIAEKEGIKYGGRDSKPLDVYVVGAGNAGKSTLINSIVQGSKGGGFSGDSDEKEGKRKHAPATKAKKRAGTTKSQELTESTIPGTTLNFIRVNLGKSKNSLYDTPGLLINGTLTSLLTPAELKMSIPKKQIKPLTFRVKSGGSVFVGGLVRVDVIGDSLPFLITFFVSDEVRLHPCKTENSQGVLEKHGSVMLSPPVIEVVENEAGNGSDGENESSGEVENENEGNVLGRKRLAQLGPMQSQDFEVIGNGWKTSSADITLRGLGWFSICGSGTCNLRVTLPEGMGVDVRPPLMPRDVWGGTGVFTGSRVVRRVGKGGNSNRKPRSKRD